MAVAGGVVEHHVPHYDIFGHQHHRAPFKDKRHLLEQDIRHPRWLGAPPAVKTRAELHQARHKGRVPDSTYDFDGDGVVGQLDHFIGRCFDQDNDGSLTRSERSRANKALSDGFLNKYVRGLDSTGQVGRGCAVQQRRGVITMADNTQDISALTYPPHHNAHMHPPNGTKTALDISRKAEAKAQGAQFGERYAEFCAPVGEPAPPNHMTHPRTCPVSHISERAEADHQASRVRGGLLPQGSALNPERELKAVGLGHVDEPVFGTRSQLLETRREAMKREAEALAVKAEESCVPLSVRQAEVYAKEYEFRRPDHVPMTLTRLKDRRKKDRIEHDMERFARSHIAPREYPRFSDNPEVPFWLADQPAGSRAAASAAPAMARSFSEPTFKVTDLPFGHEPARQGLGDLPIAAHEAAAMAGLPAHAEGSKLGSRTVKRWTAEMIERGEGRNKPRLFDSIQPVRIGPMDLTSLDLTSSMEPVRRAAYERMRGGEQATIKGNPMLSRLWSDPSLAPTATADGGASGKAPPGARSSVAQGAAPAKALRKLAEPAARASVEQQVAAPSDPRFFGSAAHITRSTAQTGVRCGGFHRSVAGAQDRTAQRTGRAAKGEPPALAQAQV